MNALARTFNAVQLCSFFKICFLLGVLGNFAVIILKPNWQHLSSLSQSLMLNLAISDLICLLPLPLWIYTFVKGWTLGLVACKLLAYFMYCSLYSILLTVTVLSVQRYLVAVLLKECLIGFFSISVVTFSYMGLHRKVNQAAFFNNPQTTRLVTSIIVTLFVLRMPFYITNVLGLAALSLKNEALLKFCWKIWNLVTALVVLNSCLNPLLYAFAVCRKRENE
ncbi:C-C chemokine receptor 1-like protein 1 [Gymnodraco acuticeps]|uniref:C-C chemokine receptor 1-like protein 1 n=1 Tax=Gymnodraco acuticeps TaxID=8218 RepID=A0A6P8TWJ9_GYMAC|nr:C-C chemokine receptor 1-like protein 1 [Gymnodraco acuticeps]